MPLNNPLMLRRLFNRQPDPNNPPVIDFIPSLVSRLIRAEEDKGSPLTEPEVLAIRDTATTMRVTLKARDFVWLKRGYRDIDPDDVWNDWQRYRADPHCLDLC